MRRSIAAVVVAVLVQQSFPAWSREVFTLEECYRASLRRNEDLLNQQELVVQAEETYRQAVGSILPNISGNAAYTRWGNFGVPRSVSGGAGADFFPAEERTLSLTATQPLFRGFREYAALRQTEDQAAVQRDTWKWIGIQLYSEVARSFYTVVAYETDLAHADEEIRIYDRRIEDLQKRVRIGRSRHAEVLTLQTARALLQAQREREMGRLAVARLVLAFLTGLDQTIALSDTDPVHREVEPEERYLASLENRPDIRAARRQTAIARENILIAGGAHWPSLDATADYFIERGDATRFTNWDVVLALSLPIFQGGVISSRTRVAESQCRQSEVAYNRALRTGREDIAGLRLTVISELAQVSALEAAFQLAEESYRANLRDDDLGLVTTLDVLQALVAYRDARRSLDEARFTAKLDFIRLEVLAGRRPAAPPERRP